MLSPLYFTTFSEVDARLVRFSLRLMRDYDLTNFRVFYITRMMQQYRSSEVAQDIEALVRLGFLEPGPFVRGTRKRSGYPTYRIRPAYLMTPKELAGFFSDREALYERMSIAPETPCQ